MILLRNESVSYISINTPNMYGIGTQMLKTMDLTDVAPCSLVDRYLRFGKACRRHLQKRFYPEGKGLTVNPRNVNPKSSSLVSTEGSQCTERTKVRHHMKLNVWRNSLAGMTHAGKISRAASFRRTILGFRESFRLTSERLNSSSIVCNNNVNALQDLRFPQRFY